MKAAVDVRIVGFVVTADRIDHHLRLLRSGRVVQVGEPVAVHRFGEDGEVPAQALDIQRG